MYLCLSIDWLIQKMMLAANHSIGLSCGALHLGIKSLNDLHLIPPAKISEF